MRVAREKNWSLRRASRESTSKASHAGRELCRDPQRVDGESIIWPQERGRSQVQTMIMPVVPTGPYRHVLFLDEIGELTLEGQAKLLRTRGGHILFAGWSDRGSHRMADVRVVAVTNRDLSEFVRDKQFREDLFYRLSVFELMVPPLRERGDDIPRLIHHFLDHFTRQHGRLDLQIAEEAMSSMKEYAWPGNVRHRSAM